MRSVRLILPGLVLLGGPLGCKGGQITSKDLPDSANPDTTIIIQLPDAQTLPETLSSSRSCSRDLHSVVDQTGTIVETCKADQGCLDAVCVPACQAVTATRGNVGCDFLIARPPLVGYPDSCFAIFIANNWVKEVTIQAFRGDRSYDTSKFTRLSVAGTPETAWPTLPASGLPTGQVAVVFLEGGAKEMRGCPIEGSPETSTIIEQTGRGQAWHIVTDIPVSLYDIIPYGGADSDIPSAGLVLPTTTFSDNYVAVLPMFRLANRRISVASSQWAQIMAVENDTEVKIVPRTDLPSGNGVSAAPTNSVTTYSLSAGEVIQWNREDGKAMEMTGSIISSNKPIGFVGGNEYLCLESSTNTVGGCDSAHQQIPPVNALGSRYVVAPHPNRLASGQPESIWYRVVGAVNETDLVYNPKVSGAPTALAQGQWFDFQAVGAFELASQDNEHPFYLAQTMAGAGTPVENPTNLGDEEFVNVVPPAQYFSSYVFHTDQTYATTILVLTQCDEGRGFKDVEVKCRGPVAGWSPFGGTSQCRWTTVTLVDNDQNVGACKNGPQFASSAEPFGLTVWGLASYSSYAYPAGAGITPINKVVIPPIPIP